MRLTTPLLIAQLSVIGIAAFLLFHVFSIFELNFDNITFLVTGTRLVTLDLEKLYTPTGMGPFAYMPPAAFFFAPFSAFGMQTARILSGLFNFGCLAAFLLLTANYYCRCVPDDAKRYNVVIVNLCFCAYYFAVWESLYIGQIEAFLLLGASLMLFSNPSAARSGLLIAVLINFKPQLGIFVLMQTARRGLMVLMFLAVFLVVIAAAYILLTLIVGKPFLFFEQMKAYSDIGSHIAANFDVTNQSLEGAIKRAFTGNSYAGRYFPTWYGPPQTMDHHLIVLAPGLVQGLIWVLKGLFVVTAGWVLFRTWRDEGPDWEYAFIIFNVSVPILSPLFWQAHILYLIPVSVWLAVRGKDSGRLPVVLLAAAAIVMVAIGNPVVLGGRIADLVHAYDVFTITALIHAVLCLCYPWWRRKQSESRGPVTAAA